MEHLQVVLASEESIYRQGLITGYFGKLTEKAVKLFQKRHKIPATGAAGQATLKKLEELSRVETVKDKAAIFEKALSRELKLGSTGLDVSTLQLLLTNAGVYPAGLTTGYFGRLTQSALTTFQKEQNISPSSGRFDPATKKRMLNIIRLRGISL